MTFTDKINTVGCCLTNSTNEVMRNTHCDVQYINHFVVLVLSVSLWLQQSKSVVTIDEKSNATVYRKNGIKAVYLSCGEVPAKSVAVEWIRYLSNQSKKILKIYNNKTGELPNYYDNHTSSKYDISESVRTSLLIKNIDFSDAGKYICRTLGGASTYRHTTTLHVEGE